MRRRIPIRLRLAATSVVLVLLVLGITGTAVVVLEQRSLEDGLAQQAELEARSLLAVAARAEAPLPDGGTRAPEVEPAGSGDDAIVPGVGERTSGASEEEPGDADQGDDGSRSAGAEDGSPESATLRLDASTRPYLVRRSAADTLLAVRAPGAPAVINREDARPLVPYLDDPVGTTSAELDDDRYTIAVARDGSGISAAAAVSGEQAAARMGELIRALLLASGLGVALTLLGAWLAARSALRPLTLISRRAAAVTAGSLDARVGPIGGHDEIATLTASVDEMLARLETAFAAQQRFVQDASHELRTPITIARGHLEVADPQHEDPAEVQAAIDLAVAELARMGELVERLLVLARAGELPPGRLRRVAANALAAEALERVRGDDGRRWRLQPADGDPEVLVDHDALVDVLVNLLRNAERHTPLTGAIAIEVAATADAVELRVADEGEGIDPALLPDIFERFTRADAARTRDAGGAGLGLAISRAYVEAHGGSIAVASAPGQGSVFTVRLPRAGA